MIISDLIIMGRACPEPMRGGRVTVCLAGWSESQGFVRLYPTRPDLPWRQWDVIRVEVERNPQDSRLESWKIAGSRAKWESLADRIEVVGHLDDDNYKRGLVVGLTDEGIHVLKKQQRSLGIVKPEILKTYFRKNPRYFEVWQAGLPGLTDLDKYYVKRDFPYEPRIVYTYRGCQTVSGYHDHQVLEWGFFEWFRKHPDRKEQVWENAGIGRQGMEIYLLVGNQAAHRATFMIISILRFASGPVSLPLLPYRRLPDPE